MKGYQGSKKEDVKCHVPLNSDGCYRRVSVRGEKMVYGDGGCFNNEKKACVEEVTKVKFNEATGCIPQVAIDPVMNKELKEKCQLIFVENEKEGSPATKRKREEKRGR